MAVPDLTLNDGNTIPQLGFGVFQVPPEETADTTGKAFDVGYRHIDTAEMYANERGVGEAFRASGLGRNVVYITSKLHNSSHRPDDARRAVDGGADAIYCSNHGGRQANGGIAAIDMLPGVVEAAGDTPVLFDSGVRSGSDVIKAVALGARMVGIGRPYTYGLALDGAEGAAHVLRCVLAEADLLMAVNGYPTIADVRAAGAVRVTYRAGLAADWARVPEPLALGLVRLAGHLWTVRDGDAAPPAAVAALWSPWRRMRLGGPERRAA